MDTPASRADIFSAIRSPDTRLDTLRQLKNIVLGHDEQKLAYVREGLVDVLLCTLEDGDCRQARSRKLLQADTEIVIILGSLALGGSSLLPIHDVERLIPILLDLVDSQSSSFQLLQSSLRTLNSTLPLPSVTRRTELSTEISTNVRLLEASLRTLNYTLSLSSVTRRTELITQVSDYPSTLRSIYTILSAPETPENTLHLATILVTKTCIPGDARWQDAVAEAGILAALIKRLATLIRANEDARLEKGSGFLKIERPFVDKVSLSKSSSTVSLLYQRRLDLGRNLEKTILPLPSALFPANHVAALFEAISVAIRGSKFRADECVFAIWITDILGEEAPQGTNRTALIWKDGKHQAESQEAAVAASGGYTFSGQEFPPLSPTAERHSHTRTTSSGNISHAANTTSIPPTDHTLDAERPKSPIVSTLNYAAEKASDPESPLIPWLMTFIRLEKEPLTKLMAINLLTDLVQTGCVSQRNVKEISRLIVPTLVRFLDEVDTSTVFVKKAYDLNVQAQEVEWAIRERAPTILATLLTDNIRMQAAAFEADAVKRLAGMLKRAFDAIPSTGDSDGSISEGHDVLWTEKVYGHQLRVREGTLKALAAIGLLENSYRKAIIDSGALPFIVGSLTPEPTMAPELANNDTDMAMSGTQDGNASSQPNNGSRSSSVPLAETSQRGNPVQVLIGALNVIRSLSRSVSVLSTDLIDENVSGPLFRLLSDQSIQVRIAATATTCNLLFEFSPLRPSLQKLGIVEVLCKFVRDGDGNVCDYSGNGVSRGEFDKDKEELRWNAIWALKHLVLCKEEAIIREILSLLDARWLLEQIAIDGLPLSFSAAHESGHSVSDDTQEEGRQILESHQISFAGKIFDRLSASYKPPRTDELQYKALIDFQEQALNLIRNIVTGKFAADMFSSILTATSYQQRADDALAQANTCRFYDVLTYKLRNKPDIKITFAIIYILVHVASCPDHRELLINQEELFEELIPLFDLAVDDVRIGLPWLAINLTWPDETDNFVIRLRIRLLRKYQYVDKLETLFSRSGLRRMKSGGAEDASGGGTAGDNMTSGETSRNKFGDSTGSVNARPISLDLRERCRQALDLINNGD